MCGPRGSSGAVRAGRPAAGCVSERPTLWGQCACRGLERRTGRAHVRGVSEPDECLTEACGTRGEQLALLGDEVGVGPVDSGGWPRRRPCLRARAPVAGVERRARAGLWPVASLRVPH